MEYACNRGRWAGEMCGGFGSAGPKESEFSPATQTHRLTDYERARTPPKNPGGPPRSVSGFHFHQMRSKLSGMEYLAAPSERPRTKQQGELSEERPRTPPKPRGRPPATATPAPERPRNKEQGELSEGRQNPEEARRLQRFGFVSGFHFHSPGRTARIGVVAGVLDRY
ncbi:hypothetical protein C8R44DRAFT_859849 [Mycena epipterygia]|nr:hypothetical protein C8R44DRAFT_859849 [Mycena epipterygia]